ncbi:MAG: NUDIX domain-containing protein [Chloroflexota bacterium]
MNRVVRQSGCIIFKNGEVVLRRTADGSLVFPKGHLEPGESEAQAATREAAEETGLAVRIVRPVGEVTFNLGEEERYVTYFQAETIRELDTWAVHLGHDVLLVPRDLVRNALTHQSSRTLWDTLDAAQKESKQ